MLEQWGSSLSWTLGVYFAWSLISEWDKKVRRKNYPHKWNTEWFSCETFQFCSFLLLPFFVLCAFHSVVIAEEVKTFIWPFRSFTLSTCIVHKIHDLPHFLMDAPKLRHEAKIVWQKWNEHCCRFSAEKKQRKWFCCCCCCCSVCRAIHLIHFFFFVHITEERKCLIFSSEMVSFVWDEGGR